MVGNDSEKNFENSVDNLKGEDEPIIIKQELIQQSFKGEIVQKKNNEILEGISNIFSESKPKPFRNSLFSSKKIQAEPEFKSMSIILDKKNA